MTGQTWLCGSNFAIFVTSVSSFINSSARRELVVGTKLNAVQTTVNPCLVKKTNAWRGHGWRRHTSRYTEDHHLSLNWAAPWKYLTDTGQLGFPHV